MNIAIEADRLGKRYNREWVFRRLTDRWATGDVVGIHGPNGSGKSTLLHVLSGFYRPSGGKLVWTADGKILDVGSIYLHLTQAAPYTSLVEEMSASEFFRFHFRFKAPLAGWDFDRIMDRMGLETAVDRPMVEFSSGMKQRVKLASALLSASEVVFLDEPTTNLDEAGKGWFQDLLAESLAGRIVFVASNDRGDFAHCNRHLSLSDMK